MIIPKINLESETSSLDHGCLFGKLILTASASSEQLLATIRRLSGTVDLQVEVSNCSFDDAVSMLNEGASEVIIELDRASEFADEIPPERLRLAVDIRDNHWQVLTGMGTHWLILLRRIVR